MTISEKVAYLKGLAEGLNLDTEKSKEGKLISVMIGILEEMGMTLEDLTENAVALGEEIDCLTDDVEELETILYGDEALDFDDEDDCGCGCGHEHFLPCPTCEEKIIIDEAVLESGEAHCASCGERFALHIHDDDELTEEV